MIGFIAGAGIVVRNSIILVDFIHLRLNQGMSLADAVVDAGAVRFRPMMLTAAAVIVGSGVILFDPIFQGLAISLMAGEVASLFLSRMTVPILFYMSERRNYREPIEDMLVATEWNPADGSASEDGGGEPETLSVVEPANMPAVTAEEKDFDSRADYIETLNQGR
jgi:hypothetical protein